MWGDESEAVAPIIWLYQIVDAQKEDRRAMDKETWLTSELLHIHGLQQDCVMSGALAMELPQSSLVLRHQYNICQCKYMGQVMKLWLSCYLFLLSVDSKTR